MPDLLTLELAVPRCTRRLIQPKDGQRQHGVHVTCCQPMVYVPGRNSWRCPCGAEESGILIGAQRMALLADAA